MIQSSLRTALQGATSYGDALIWNQIAKALGSVRIEIGRSQAGAALDNRTESLEAHPTEISARASVSELEELIVAALVLAEALEQDSVALRLDEALISVTGKGISPEGWPAA